MLSQYGKLYPIIIPSKTGLMNPSILNDNGKLLVNLRQVNYAFYHSEHNFFHHPFGPLTYLHPENDVKLRTWNWILELDSSYEVKKYTKTDTSEFDVEPLWSFIGHEDARLVRWKGKLYQTGVRRDTTTNGKGRMELSEINENIKEISRQRIPTPVHDSYCEKNWMPVLDQPYTYVKWANPTEIVQYDPETKKTTQLLHKEQTVPWQTRGGSQVIPIGDYYYAVTHDVDLFKSETGKKNAKYTHRIVVWDRDWNLVKLTSTFNFMDGHVEFCTGICVFNGKILMTFGFQDNAAFLLELDMDKFEGYINERNIVNTQV